MLTSAPGIMRGRPHEPVRRTWEDLRHDSPPSRTAASWRPRRRHHPSPGVPGALRARLDAVIRTVESRGFDVVTGSCRYGHGHVSAPAADRAREPARTLA